MNIKCKTTFSKGRIETFYRFHFLKKSPYKFVELGLVLIAIIVAVMGFTLLENLYVFAVALVLIFVIIGTRNYRISNRVKKLLKTNPPDVLPYYVIIKDSHIEYIRDTNTINYEYNKIVEICEIDECFYIYVSETSAIILPKFSIDYEQREKLREFFKKKCTENNCIFKQYKFISVQDKEGVV